jgi:hypothetical protein
MVGQTRQPVVGKVGQIRQTIGEYVVGMVGDTREPNGIAEMGQTRLPSRGKGGSNLPASRWIRWVKLRSHSVG